MFTLVSLSERQREAALSDFNRWVTGVAIGRPPTIEDCFEHYIRSAHANGVPATHTFEVQEQLLLFNGACCGICENGCAGSCPTD